MKLVKAEEIKNTPVYIDFANLQRVLDQAAIIAVTDVKGKIIFANDKFCQISKYTLKELLGQDHRIINSGYHPKEFIRDLWRTIAKGKVWRGEICNRAKDSSIYWVDTTIIPILNKKGKPSQYLAIRYEITQKRMAEDAVKEFPQQILAAQEEERKFISQEIHDDFGQLLIALKIYLVHNMADLMEQYPKLQQLTVGLKVKINEIIEKARKLSHKLAPPNLKYVGLSKAVRELVDTINVEKKLSIKFSHRMLKDVDLGGKDIVLYRIIQEALSNIVKHAQAKNAEVSLQYKKGKVYLRIKDDGKGFDPKSFRKSSKSLGLSLMRERSRSAGGILQVKSAPGLGTQIRLNFPAEPVGSVGREKQNAQK